MERLTDPLPYAGCYTLDLYCKYKHPPGISGFAQYTSEKGSDAKSDARADGWVIHDDRTATCPRCSGKKPKRRDDPFSGCKLIPLTSIVKSFQEPPHA